MKDPIIQLKGLTKCYGPQKAVDDLSLDIHKGEIFGLLGPNGAGKTTTILMMLGLTDPTSGSAFVCGHNATSNPISVKRKVGYMPDSLGFYDDMTAARKPDVHCKVKWDGGKRDHETHSRHAGDRGAFLGFEQENINLFPWHETTFGPG